jgi:hypothetical protein
MAEEIKKEVVESIQPNQVNNSELETKIKDLEKKLGEASSEKEKMEAYVKQAEELAGVIDYWSREDPGVINTLKEKYKKVYGSPVVPEGKPAGEQPKKESAKEAADDMENGKIKEVNEKLDKVTTMQRDQVIRDFEEKYGISGLPEEERKEVRRNIESHLNVFGQSVTNAPVENLGTVLKEAYKVVSLDKAVKEKGYEAAADAYRNLSGSMPTMSSRNLPAEDEKGVLTPKQKEWADKLGVDSKRAEEVNKAKDSEFKRVPEAEKNIKK